MLFSLPKNFQSISVIRLASENKINICHTSFGKMWLCYASFDL
jgi:hypothetical protein